METGPGVGGAAYAGPVSDLVRRPRAPGEATADRLLTAALEELRETGYDDLNIRRVARRAGVSPATAYNYYASKEHLFAAVHLRTLRALPDVPADGRPVEERLAQLLQSLADTLAPEPELRTAMTAALLGHDPASARVREVIVDEFVARFDRTCGDDLDAAGREIVLLAFIGAMIMAGMGRLSFADIEGRINDAIRRIR